MNTIDLTLIDSSRARAIPVCVYLPDGDNSNLPVIIFSNGYQSQDDLKQQDVKPAYKNHTYLAEFFSNKGYGFITIQHDILGDKDGLETIDPTLPQAQARRHLWERGEQNILFVINELKQKLPQLNFDKFIIGGHSNGGDIAKFYANNHVESISHIIVMDGRRCPIEPGKDLKLLIFEATDTSTDIGVIPDEGTETNPKRKNLEWVIIKPKHALHASYSDSNITNELKKYVLGAINWFVFGMGE